MVALKHLRTILTHKYWVFYFACRLGIGWQGFWHDMSKFSPTEFLESMKYYTGTRSPIDACKEDNGYSMAWLHHKGRNPHHYEYWQDNFDNGGTPLLMPRKYMLEMLCDYMAAGVTYGGNQYSFNDEYRWWKGKSSKPLAMHTKQKEIFENLFKFLHETFQDTPIISLTQADWNSVKLVFNLLTEETVIV